MCEPADNVTIGVTDTARTEPDRPALIFGRRNLSFAELDRAIWAMAAHLSRHGVARGDVVSLYLSGQIDLAITFLATMRIGATPMALTTGLSVGQRTDLVQAANARFQVVEDQSASVKGVPAIHFGKIEPPRGGVQHLMDPLPEAPGKILTGSGSTGKQLLIPVNHRNIHARAAALTHNFGLIPGQRFMLVSPVHFATPLDRFLGTVTQGITCIFWDSRMRFKAAMDHARPDYLHLTVVHAHQMLAEADSDPNFDLSKLKQVSIGASPVSEALRSELKSKLKARLAINYGSNETGTLAFAFPEDLDKVRNTVGRPQHFAKLQIVDENHDPLGPGEIGQIRIKGPSNISGYVGGAAPERFIDDWFYPGDLGKWEGDGQVVHCGRADQMMILDGINIYPSEIERCLEHHAAVDEVAAFALPHSIHGQVPVCAIKPKDGSRTTSRDLMDYAKRELGLRYPRRILLMKSLPRNPQGKLIRQELIRRMVEAELSNQKP